MQLKLGISLAERVRAWAPLGPVRVPFIDLQDAFPSEGATELDAAAREAGVLAWTGRGFDVGRPQPGGEAVSE